MNARKILDVGCDAGEQTFEYLQRNRSVEVTVIEPARKSLNVALNRLKGYKVRFLNTTFEEFEPQNEKWDFVFLFDVIEHMEKPKEILEKASKLAPYLLIIVPNANSLNRIIGVELGIIPSRDHLTERGIETGHLRVYTSETFEYLLESANLEIIEKYGVFLKPMPDKIVCKWTEKTLKLLYNLGKQNFKVAAALCYLVKGKGYA